MDENASQSEATSFFALKKTINLINTVGKYLSNSNSINWKDVIKLQTDAQKFINAAASLNFPEDRKTLYKLKLPRSIKLDVAESASPESKASSADSPAASSEPANAGSTPDEVEEIHIDIDLEADPPPEHAEEPQQEPDPEPPAEQADQPADSDPEAVEITHIAEPKQLSFDGFGRSDEDYQEYEADIAKYKFNGPADPDPFTISTDEGSTDLGVYADYVKDEASHTQSDQSPETQDDEELCGIPNVRDCLTEHREKYMNLINSQRLSGVDSSIPPHLMDPKNAYLFKNNFPFSEQVLEVNEKVFGFKSFRGVQLPAINAIMLGIDCFVMMATGVGKSHCYQLPSLLLNGTVVVFSPLLSLVEDQIQSLRIHGIEADTLNHQTPADEFKSIRQSLLYYKKSFKNGSILFITPEKFDKSKAVITLLESLYEMDRLKLFVIDEAHCVSQWGHSFRKDYRKLGNLKHMFPTVPILAITATATEDVIRDITNVLCFRNHVSLITTINRPNLWIEVREKTKNYMDEIVEILKSTQGCGIVYCLTTSDCDKVAEKITKAGITVCVYHARMEIQDRIRSQKQWKRGHVRIIVATVAFGMGIDKHDVRLILHTSAPTSILSYYQEIGRAGRDGKFSTTILWYNLRDFERHKNINEAKNTGNTNYSSEMRDFCQNKTTCRRRMILQAFGERAEFESCIGCDNCCLNRSSQVMDVTDEASTILNFVQSCMARRNRGILTPKILCDSLRGSLRLGVKQYQLEHNSFHGAMKDRSQKFIYEVIMQMIRLKILKEVRRKCMSFGRTVIVQGPNAFKLTDGQISVSIVCYDDLSKRKKPKDKKDGKAKKEPEPEVAPPKAKRKKRVKGAKAEPGPDGQLTPAAVKREFYQAGSQDDPFIDLTADTESSAERSSSDVLEVRVKTEPGCSPSDRDCLSFSQKEVTQSDIIAIERNNLRRKVPGELLEIIDT